MNAVLNGSAAVGIWKRIIEPEAGTLSAAEARALLRLRLSGPDLDRADILAAKAQAGQLKEPEERELEDYLAVGSALEFLKSKARRSLRQTKAAA
jgi:hypothetical protein